MKCKMKHKKIWVSVISVVALTALVTGILTINKEIVFATDSAFNSLLRPFELPSKSEGDIEVKVRYVFDNDEVYQEKTVKSNKGKRILEKDLPVLPRDMIFTDEFKDYLVKGDGHDEVVRKVKKHPQEQTADSDEITVEEQKETNNLQQETQELKELIANLNKELKDKAEVNEQQKDKIKDLETKIKEMQSKIKSNQVAKANESLKQDIEALKKQVQSLQDKPEVKSESNVQERSAAETITDSTNTQDQGILPKTSEVVNADELSTSTESPTLNSEVTQEKKTEIRQPNQAISQASTNSSSSQGSSLGESEKQVNTNKGIPSSPSKARGKVTENKDNGNKEYPIHHGDNTDKKETDKLAADARQFVTFTTKTGKTFHLIINHDKENDNVMLLTEVSEDDLLNMVEKKTAQKQEVVKETPKKEEPLPVKKEEESSAGTYLIVVLVVVAALGAGYYFKVVKNKENKELEDMEEEDDDFFSEAEETEAEAELEQEDEEI